MKNFIAKKVMVWTLLVCWFTSAPLAALAAITIFEGDANGYGAQINSYTGAVVGFADGKNAQIVILDNVGKIVWDCLNVGAGKSLDFNFTQAGQIALNEVRSGMSKFAGKLSTSGEAGHLIISNKNGMVFLKGSSVNATGMFTATTNDVTYTNQLNGSVTIGSAYANTYNAGISLNGVKITTIGDVNIVSKGIRMENCDIFTGGTTRLISANGVNFTTSDSKTSQQTIFSNFDTHQPTDIGYYNAKTGNADLKGYTDAVYVKNSNFKGVTENNGDLVLSKTNNGRLAISTYGNIGIDTLKSGDTRVFANEGNITVSKSVINGTYGNTGFSTEADGAKIAINGSTINNASISTGGKNSTIDIQNASKINGSNIITGNENSNINIDKSTITYGNTYTWAKDSNITIKNASTINGAKVYTNEENSNISIDKSTLNNSLLETDDHSSSIEIKNASKLTNTDIYAYSKDSKITIDKSTITGGGMYTNKENSSVEIKNASKLTNTDIYTYSKDSNIIIDKSTISDSDIYAAYANSSIEIKNASKVTNTDIATFDKDSDIIIDNSTIADSYMDTHNDNSSIEIKNASKLTNTDIYTNGKNANITVNKSTITDNRKNHYGDIATYGENSSVKIENDSKLTNFIINTRKKDSNITIDKSTLNNIHMNIYGENSTLEIGNNSKLTKSDIYSNGKDSNIIIDNSTLNDTYIGIAGENSTLEIGNNSKLTKMNIIADNYDWDSQTQNIKDIAVTIDNSTLNNVYMDIFGENASIDIQNGSKIANTTTWVNQKDSKITVSSGSTLDNKSYLGSWYDSENTKITIEGAGTKINGATVETLGNDSTITVKDGATVTGNKKVGLTTQGTGSDIIVEGAGTKINGALISANYGDIEIRDGAIIDKATVDILGNAANIYISGAGTTVTGSTLTAHNDASSYSDDSGILAYNGAVINNSTLKASGQFAYISIQDGTTVNKSTLNAAGYGSFISVSGAGTKVNTGSTLLASGNGADITIYDGATVEGSKFNATGSNNNIRIQSGATVDKKSTITSGKNTILDLSVNGKGKLLNSTVTIANGTVKSGYDYDSGLPDGGNKNEGGIFDNTTIKVTNGVIYILRDSELNNKNTLTAQYIGIEDCNGSGILNLSATHVAGAVEIWGYTHTGDVNINSKGIVIIGNSQNLPGTLLDLSGNISNVSKSDLPDNIIYLADVGRNQLLAPSEITGTLNIATSAGTIIANTQINGQLKLSSQVMNSYVGIIYSVIDKISRSGKYVPAIYESVIGSIL